MQSKISYFNKTLFLKNLSRFWPLWGGASFIGALFPLALLTQLLRYGKEAVVGSPVEMTLAYYTVLCSVPVISLLYGLLCAMAVWSYLCNARSVSLMHTLPMRREGLFATNFLSGLAMLLIPYAVTGALCVVITAAYGLFEPVGLLTTVLGVLGESFFYFSSATLAAFITGNIFAMPALYLLLHFLEAILDLLLSAFAGGFIFGLDTDYTGYFEFLSPTVYLMRSVAIDREYQDFPVWSEYTKTEILDTRLVAVRLGNAWVIAAYALVGAALLAVAFALYRRRRSERAGDVVAVGWMRPFFRYGVAGLAALLGGQLLYSLFFGDTERFKVLPLMVCMFVAGAIGLYGASMLLAKSLRVFKNSWKGLALVAAGIVVVCGALAADVFNVAGRVPAVGQLEQLEFRVAGNTYYFYPGEGDVLLERVRELHRAIIADEAYILAYDRDRTGNTAGESTSLRKEAVRQWSTTTVRLIYTTKSGQTVRRFYGLPITRERLTQAGTYDALLDALVNSREMRLKRLHVGDQRCVIDGGYLFVEEQGESYELSDREAAAVLEAVAADAAAGRWGQYDWLYDGDNRGDIAIDLELNFRLERGRYGRDWISITLRPEMTAATDCLLELGLVTEKDLKTYQELYPERYDDAEEIPSDVVRPEEALVEAGATVPVG